MVIRMKGLNNLFWGLNNWIQINSILIEDLNHNLIKIEELNANYISGSKNLKNPRDTKSSSIRNINKTKQKQQKMIITNKVYSKWEREKQKTMMGVWKLRQFQGLGA